MLKFPKSNKIFITSDIHGGKHLLLDLVKKVDDDSYLFLIGDFIEKGQDSLGTLEYVYELSKKPNVFVTIGNNDHALLRALNEENIDFFKNRINKPTSILYQMKNKLKIDDPVLLQKVINIEYKHLIDFLKSLKYYYIIEDFLLIHAGINKTIENSSLRDMIGQDDFYNKGHDEDYIVVCGHYPSAMYYYDEYNNNILIDEEKKIICIDGGYKETNLGQLNMLEIEKMGFKYTYNKHYVDDFNKFTILNDCASSGNKRGICFPNYEVEVLKKDMYFSNVITVNTDEIFEVKNELIECALNKCYVIDDCPNNHLEVRKGDVVSLIWDNFLGYSLVKKDGICGWIKKENN